MGRFRANFGLILTAVAGLAACNSSSTSVVPPNHPLLHPIKHVIIMMQENRSFNNIFAGFPGADTAMSGACEKTSWCKNGTIALHSVTLETTGHLGLGTDIDHSHNGFKIECDADSSDVCQNNGFDKIRFGESGNGPPAKTYPYAYVDRSESKTYWTLASTYALADHMFFTDTASSFIAHQMILTGSVAIGPNESLTDQPDRTPWGCDAYPGTATPILRRSGFENMNGPFPCFEYKYIGGRSMADVLDAANVSWKYYVSSLTGDFSGDVWDGFDAIAKVRCASFTPPEHCHGKGADWKNVSTPNTTFFTALKNGTLPSVSWLIPILADSDHPASGCNHGPHWVASVVNAVGESKYWDSTAIVLLWDDWGGWYDPVPPDQTGYTSLGFRVPLVVISPYAVPKSVDKTPYQFGSILKYVEQNFGAGSLHTTDESSTSIAGMFNYDQKPKAFVPVAVPPQKKCPSAAGIKEIIEHDGGAPE